MTQTLEKNQLFTEIQERQLMLMGVAVKNNQKKLSFEDIRKMKQLYRDMYFAFTSINWGQGMTLGMAWQKALKQMETFVALKIKTPNHPMNTELIKFHNEFRKDMSKHIMTSEFSEVKLLDRHKNLFLQDGMKQLKKSKDSLNDMHKQFMPEKIADKNQNVKTFENAQLRAKQMMQQMALLNLAKLREREAA